MKNLDESLDFLLPEIKKAKDLGMEFNRPVLLKMVAEKYFLAGDTITLQEMKHYLVCRARLRQLNNTGEFDWGKDEISN